MDLFEVRTAVERFVCDLNDIRRRAEEREIAAKRDLDQEAPALQRKISALRKLKTQLKEELNARQQKGYDDARQRLAEIEKAYD
ncbi:hypothetical protein CABS01_17189, partial [Colletotrichum abscissum]|uniref:uncharacterized protein n=1 Tax=Colletotrichum abscissum TaxID=1671311 RepID=UPI0027D4F96D